ncbi:MAG: glycerate kinase [Candidatus Velthaea sp.]
MKTALHATRVVVAPDKFKGSAGAATIGAALIAGMRDVWGDAPTYVSVPMADGGDGTVDAFLATGAIARTVRVRGPLGESVEATYARNGETAIIEMAAASGLALAGERRDALSATTFGTGELMRDALDRGARRIVLGIGGSATTDGGAGALAALGARFLDDAGSELAPVPRDLTRLARIDVTALDARLAATPIAVACDVDNPLLGTAGAAAVYGPQKGASTADVAALDGVLGRIADAAVRAGRPDLRALPGSGAAGGLGWGFATFAGARLAPGFGLIADVRGLDAALATATLCITGEGRIDAQTLRGKVVAGVAALARPLNIPVVAFGGSVAPEAESALAAAGVVCLPVADGPLALADAMARAPELVRAAAARFARIATL